MADVQVQATLDSAPDLHVGRTREGQIFIAFSWLVFAILIGVYASSKGRSGVGFFFLAVLLSPLVAFIIALAVQPVHAITDAHAVQSGEYRKCPYCAELVKLDAIVCKHCGRDLPAVGTCPKIRNT